MPTTSTILGRMLLDHPDLGFDGGVTLEQKIKTLYTRLSDSMPSRFFTAVSLANGASVDFEHGFHADFAEMGFRLYLWDNGTGELTRVNPTTGWTIAATAGFLTTKTTVTNNTGSAKTFALWLFHWPLVEKLDDLTDVDLVTTSPEDGQALVYSAALAKWLPGASGDSSFKIQGVVDPNATIKGGFLMLPDGRELATYDGAGSASTDFGKDITVDLDAVLGASPANNTTYYLYIDLATLGAAVTCTDNGRKLYAVQYSNFYLSTTAPDAMNRSRYIARGFIRSATTGTVWSGSGAAFGTLAFLKGEQPPVAVSPLVFSQSQTLVSSVGTSGQIRQGHNLSQKSFPAAAWNAANLSVFPLAQNGTSLFGGRDLTLYNGAAGAVGILGDANSAISLNGTNQYLGTTDAFFDPGNQNFTVGGWFYSADWILGTGYGILGQGNTTSDRSFALYMTVTGTFALYCSSSGTSWELSVTDIAHGIADNTPGWHHIALRYKASTNTFNLFLDGKIIGSASLSGALHAASSNSFSVGAVDNAAFFTGRVDEFFMAVGVDLGDHDIAKICATRLDHNKALPSGRQGWTLNHYAAGVAPVTPLLNAVLDQSDSNSVFLDLSQADPTDRVDIQLQDTGAAGAVSVPVQTAEFTFSATGQLTAAGTGFPTNLVEDVRSLQGWQKTSNGWEPIDLVGMVWVTATGAKYLQGNIDALVPSATNPVRVIVASTASAQAVGVATATQAGLLVAGAIPGRLDGVAPAANIVGETVFDSGISSIDVYAALGNWTASNDISVSLSPGVWKIDYGFGIQWVAGVGSALLAIKLGCVDASNTELDLSYNIAGYGLTNPDAQIRNNGSFILNTATAKVIRVAGYAGVASGSVSTPPSLRIRNDGATFNWGKGFILATRIA
jgi:hypothetical protein